MERTSVHIPDERRTLTSRLAGADTWAAVAILAVAVALFAPLRIIGDGYWYFVFLEHLFGDTKQLWTGGIFGLALMNAPFYALGKLLVALGVHSIDGSPTTMALVSLGGNVYMLLSATVAAFTLRALGVPNKTFVILAAVVGSPLLYYGLFLPSGNHSVETFLVTAATGLLLLRFRRPHLELELTAAVGATLGIAAATRYSLAAMVGGLAIVEMCYRRWKPALVVVVTSAATFWLSYLAPYLNNAPIFAKGGVAFAIGWAPLTPFRMLFTDDRGIFIWTPVMLIGIIGFIFALVRRRSDRLFYAQVGGMQLAFVCFHFLVPEWWAGGSFSSRFFTSMFPMVAIGLGEALMQRRKLTYVLATLCALWTLYLCINVAAGIDVVRGSQRPPHLTSATDVALFPVNKHTTWKVYLYSIWHMSHLSGR
jgi:hypothetical protein